MKRQIIPIKTVEQAHTWLWFAYGIAILATVFINHLIAQARA